MAKITVEQMLEAGLHFGHQSFRWNPKMKPYIFDARDGVHIIDLTQTEKKLNDALGFVEKLAAKGESLLLVGTKRQAHEIVKELGKLNPEITYSSIIDDESLEKVKELILRNFEHKVVTKN